MWYCEIYTAKDSNMSSKTKKREKGLVRNSSASISVEAD